MLRESEEEFHKKVAAQLLTKPASLPISAVKEYRKPYGNPGAGFGAQGEKFVFLVGDVAVTVEDER